MKISTLEISIWMLLVLIIIMIILGIKSIFLATMIIFVYIVTIIISCGISDFIKDIALINRENKFHEILMRLNIIPQKPIVKYNLMLNQLKHNHEGIHTSIMESRLYRIYEYILPQTSSFYTRNNTVNVKREYIKSILSLIRVMELHEEFFYLYLKYFDENTFYSSGMHNFVREGIKSYKDISAQRMEYSVYYCIYKDIEKYIVKSKDVVDINIMNELKAKYVNSYLTYAEVTFPGEYLDFLNMYPEYSKKEVIEEKAEEVINTVNSQNYYADKMGVNIVNEVVEEEIKIGKVSEKYL